MSQQLERDISRFRDVRRDGAPDVSARISAAALRAAIEMRMRNLERDVGEVKGRLNGLIFVVIGAGVTQVVLRRSRRGPRRLPREPRPGRCRRARGRTAVARRAWTQVPN